MNYRHAYHAGNFADVFKHVILSRLIEYLKRKDKPFRVIDTHAGAGFHHLDSDEAQRTGEWRDGVGRMFDAPIAGETGDLLKPWLDAVRAFNPEGTLKAYPGSPVLSRALLRDRDRLTAIELHPADCAALKSRFAGDFRTRVIALDGWLALGAQVPPKERRGLVLVDPPFEEEGEFDRLAEGLAKAWRRWPGGIYALWYPIKHPGAVATFRKRLRALGIPGILDIALVVEREAPVPALHGCGMVVVNPPFVLKHELEVLLPVLAARLGRGDGAGASAEWLTAAP